MYPLTIIIPLSILMLSMLYAALSAQAIGRSETLPILSIVLTLVGFAGLLFEIGFLIYYGISVSWYAPFLLFIISTAVGFIALVPAVILEKLVGLIVMGLLGLTLIPISAYLLIINVSNVVK